MTTFKKMLLVPYSKSNVDDKNTLDITSNDSKLVELDTEMNSILQNKSSQIDDKIKLYNTALSKYIKLYDPNVVGLPLGVSELFKKLTAFIDKNSTPTQALPSTTSTPLQTTPSTFIPTPGSTARSTPNTSLFAEETLPNINTSQRSILDTYYPSTYKRNSNISRLLHSSRQKQYQHAPIFNLFQKDVDNKGRSQDSDLDLTSLFSSNNNQIVDNQLHSSSHNRNLEPSYDTPGYLNKVPRKKRRLTPTPTIPTPYNKYLDSNEQDEETSSPDSSDLEGHYVNEKSFGYDDYAMAYGKPVAYDTRSKSTSLFPLLEATRRKNRKNNPIPEKPIKTENIDPKTTNLVKKFETKKLKNAKPEQNGSGIWLSKRFF